MRRPPPHVHNAVFVANPRALLDAMPAVQRRRAWRNGARSCAAAEFASLDAFSDTDPTIGSGPMTTSGAWSTLSRRSFVAQTFGILAAVLAITTGCAICAAQLDLATTDSIVCMFAALLLMGSLFAVSGARQRLPKVLTLPIAGLFATLQGVAIGPIVNGYWLQADGTWIVGGALATTAAVFVGIALYTLTTRGSRRDFSWLGGFLFTGLIVALALSILSFYIATPAFDLALTGVGAMLFTGYLLYDLSRLWSSGKDDPVLAALNLYLNVLNVFLSLLRLFEFLVSGD